MKAYIKPATECVAVIGESTLDTASTTSYTPNGYDPDATQLSKGNFSDWEEEDY